MRTCSGWPPKVPFQANLAQEDWLVVHVWARTPASVHPLAFADPSASVQVPVVSVTPTKRASFRWRYRMAVQTPRQGRGSPSPVLRPFTPAIAAASAADLFTWRSTL